MREVNWNNVKREAPKWFRDAKFGLFFHWGPYSVPAYQNEWYSRNMYCKGLEQNQYHEKTYGSLHDFGYKDFYDMLKGEKFDPDQWASLVKRSGAKYAGAVSEHADNFSMWDSAVNPINSMNYGPHRDIVGECTEAFRKQGIRTVATFHHQWLWGWFMSTDNEADVYIPVLHCLLRQIAIFLIAILTKHFAKSGGIRCWRLSTSMSRMRCILTAVPALSRKTIAMM